MIRTVFAVATMAAIAIGVCAAVAQEDPIKARKALTMKANGDQAKILADMSKGDKPYDQAAVAKALAQFQDAAAKMPGLYPDNTKDGDPSDQFNASPKVWENMADFKARFVKFGEDCSAPKPRPPASRMWTASRQRWALSARTIAAPAIRTIASRRAEPTSESNQGGVRAGRPALCSFKSPSCHPEVPRAQRGPRRMHGPDRRPSKGRFARISKGDGLGDVRETRR